MSRMGNRIRAYIKLSSNMIDEQMSEVSEKFTDKWDAGGGSLHRVFDKWSEIHLTTLQRLLLLSGCIHSLAYKQLHIFYSE